MARLKCYFHVATKFYARANVVLVQIFIVDDLIMFVFSLSSSIYSKVMYFALPGTPESRLAAVANTISYNRMIARERNFLSDITSAHSIWERWTVPLSKMPKNFLRSQASTLQDRVSEADRMHRVKEGLVHNIRSYNPLDMSLWMYVFHENIRGRTMSISLDSHLIIATHMLRKTPPA